MSPYKPRFPVYNLKDKDQIVDSVGNIYEYDLETDSWLLVGEIKIPDVVTDDNDGIATSETYRKIYVLQRLKSKGINFNTFKLDYKTEKAPYYYYFHSSDDLIKFIPEARDQLRIEVDRDRLYNKLLSTCCVGPPGRVGDIGDAGLDGTPASNEIFKSNISFVNNLYILNDTVYTPIDTPISIRLFKNDVQVSEVIYYLTGGFDVDALIDKSASSVSYNNNILSATLKIVGDTTGIWKHKSRQVGEKGLPGSDGNGFFDISVQVLDNSDLTSSEVVSSVRKSNINDNIYVLNKEISDEFCVVNLNTLPIVSPVDNIHETEFCAVEVSTKECKNIGHFKLPVKEVDEEVLDLALWTPTSDCVQAKRYHQYKFDWYNYTDVKYSHKILNNTKPGPNANCDCVEDFFMCANVGDCACGIIGVPSAPKLREPDQICNCDSPNIDMEQGNGILLQYSDLCADCGNNKYESSFSTLNNVGSAGNVSIAGVINGNVNRVKYYIKVCGKCEIDFILKKDSNVCGGESNESADPLYVDSDVVHGTIELKSINGVANISQDGRGEFISVNSVVVFTVDTTSAMIDGDVYASDELEINVTINDNKANYCYGYRLTISSGCDCVVGVASPAVEEAPIDVPIVDDDSEPPTVTVVPEEDLVARVSPSSLDFGTVFVNSMLDLIITITNVGSTFWSGSASIVMPFSIISGANYSLGAGQSQDVIIRFSPVVSGDFNGIVQFSGGTTLICEVVGTGIPEPVPFTIYLDPDSTDSGPTEWSVNGASTAHESLYDITRNSEIPPILSSITHNSVNESDVIVGVDTFDKGMSSITSIVLNFYLRRDSGDKSVTGYLIGNNTALESVLATTTGWYTVSFNGDIDQSTLDSLQIRFIGDTTAGSSTIFQAYIELNGLA